MDGIADLHTLPYFGITDWDKVTKALAEIGYDGDFTFEAYTFFGGKPEELLVDTAKYMASVGRSLIDSINQNKL